MDQSLAKNIFEFYRQGSGFAILLG